MPAPMRARSQRLSAGGLGTVQERGITGADDLLLHEITEKPGHPVLLKLCARVMRAMGSQITDAQLEARRRRAPPNKPPMHGSP